MLLIVILLASFVLAPVAGASGPDVEFRVELGPGDALGYHAYKLVLNGSGYVVFPHTDALEGPDLTVAAMVKAYSTPDWNAIASKDELDWRLYVSQVSDRWDFARRDSSGSTVVAEGAPASEGSWTRIAGVSNSTHILLYVNGALSAQASWSGAGSRLNNSLLIGTSSYNGSEMSAQRWRGEIRYVAGFPRSLGLGGLEELWDNHTVSSPVLLFDPTWLSGQGFYGLYAWGGIEGSVAREPDERWVWVIHGAYGDNALHLLFFPLGSYVVFRDPSSGAVLGSLVVSGPSTGDGLVPEASVSWSSSMYVEVEVYFSGPPSTEPLVVEHREKLELSGLYIVVLLASLFSPLVSWLLGVPAAAVMSLVSGYGILLTAREYSYASGSEDRVILSASGLLLGVVLMLNIIIMVYRLIVAARSRRKILELPETW